MSNKRTLKSLIGVGAFACCSAVLLSVTAQSAQSRQIPSVSELGDMIGGTIRFYQSLNMESEAAGAGAAVTEEPAPEAVIPEDPTPEEHEADVSRAAFSLPDFTGEDAQAGTTAAEPDTAGMVTAGVIDGETAGITDSLSLTSADPSSSPVSLTSSAAGDDDWMEGDGSGKKADEPADEKPAEESPAEKEKSSSEEEKSSEEDKKEAAAGEKTDADKTEKTGSEKAAEKSDDWMETVETADGGEELTAAASVTLTLSVDNKNHTEFLHGYEDGTARPGGKITRAEACQILYNLLKTKPKERAALSDVKDDAWYAEPVRLLAACGIVDCPGDKARPDDYMTRAELVSALTRLVQTESAGKVSFTDVSASHPYYSAIAKAVGLGWVNGYEDGTFKPDGSITRAEAAKVVNRALSRTPDKEWIDENIKDALYSDLGPDHWAYYELMEASVAHTASVADGAEKWNPAEAPAEEAATDKKQEEKTPADEKTADEAPAAEPPSGTETSSGEDTSASEKQAETGEEGTHEAAQPETTGWMDEELERMLSEPLPEEVDPACLEFVGLELYALDKDGKRMTDVTLGRYLTFGKNGRYTSGNSKLDRYVKNILKEIITEDMDREEKLKAAYEYCRDSFQYRRNNFYEVGETGWEADEALTMYEKKKGNCYNFAASFAMLARQLGYDAEAISGLVGKELQPHGWVEIVIDGERLFFDTILESSYLERGFDYDFFGQHYEKAPWPYHKQ